MKPEATKEMGVHNIFRALENLYIIFYQKDGSGVTLGLQTYLKEFNVPYVNYVAKALNNNAITKTDGKKNAITYYHTKQRPTKEMATMIFDEAKELARSAREKHEDKQEPVKKETVKSSDNNWILLKVKEKLAYTEESISTLDSDKTDIEEELERMEVIAQKLTYDLSQVQVRKEKLLFTKQIYKDLLS